MPSLLNQLIHQEYRRHFESHAAGIFVNFSGFTQSDSLAIRALVREAGGLACVLKSNIALKVLREMRVEGAEALFQGPTLVLLGKDPAAVSKAAIKFHKKTDKGAPTGGWVEGRVVGAEDVKKLSALPSREVLLGQVASVVAAPLAGFARVLNANICNLAYALEAVRGKKEKEAA